MPAETPQTADEFAPATQMELSRFVSDNAAGARRPLFPVGGRTALHYGYAPSIDGITVALSELSRIVDYPARDMTITVEAGVRMDVLSQLLRQEGQQLPIDAAQSNRATLGGVIATNTSGPRRFAYGTMRDYVIGISAVDAAGRLFHAGGRVVKNVAGYDLCKLLVGSLGTLAIITQVTLKLRPLPQSTALLWTSFDTFAQIDSALERLLLSATRPVALEVLNAEAARQSVIESRQDLPTARPVLVIGVEGSDSEIEWQRGILEQELRAESPVEVEWVSAEGATQLWGALAEYPTFSDDPLTFQANLPASKTVEFVQRATEMRVSVQAHAGNGIVIGHLPDDAVSVEKADQILTPLRNLARPHRGNLVVLNCESSWKESLRAFGDPEPSLPLAKRLKTALDPRQLLNPGRFLDAV